MLQLTKTQAQYVQDANEHLGHPGKISRREISLLKLQNITKSSGAWLGIHPELKMERGFFKLPNNDEIEVRENLPRGRKKKPEETTCVVS